MPGQTYLSRMPGTRYFSLLLIMASCSNTGQESATGAQKPRWNPPAAGSPVVSDSMTVSLDPLNDFRFAVSLRVAAGQEPGTTQGFRYDVHATYGHAEADGMVVMPAGGEHLKPLLRKAGDTGFVVGFIPGKDFGGDSSFHEYYSIAVGKQGIAIKPLKSFTLQ